MPIPSVDDLIFQGMTFGDAVVEHLDQIERASPEERYREYSNSLQRYDTLERRATDRYQGGIDAVRGQSFAYHATVLMRDAFERDMDFITRQREHFTDKIADLEREHGPMAHETPESRSDPSLIRS